MRTRFIEAQDTERQNHGKFLLLRFEPSDFAHESPIEGRPLLASLKPIRRLGGAPGPTSLLVTDLATQEGCFIDPKLGPGAVEQQFLCHPIHVCILFYPLLMLLTETADPWTLPAVVDLDMNVPQPGILIDRAGRPVSRLEWSRRVPGPWLARLRNRERDPNDEITPQEMAEMARATAPKWG